MKSETKLMKCVISAEKNATHTHKHTAAASVLWLLFLWIYEYLADLLEKKNMFVRGTRKFKKHCSKNTTKTKAITMHNVQLTMYNVQVPHAHTDTHQHTHSRIVYTNLYLELEASSVGQLICICVFSCVRNCVCMVCVCGSVGALSYVGQPEGVANMRISHWECRTIVSLRDSSSACWGTVC